MSMSVSVPLILTLLVLISGIISLVDIFYLRKKRTKDGKIPVIIDYAWSFFPVLLLVLLIRSFLIQPYKVPSGSLEPTILPGDFIVVNQFSYGLRLPVLNKKIFAVGEPKVGDIVLFRFPKDPSVIFVKRVVGVPGDHIVYRNKVLTINGDIATQIPMGMALDREVGIMVPVRVRMERLPNNVEHKIYQRPGYDENGHYDVVVPKGQYFMMGDNRDDSDDSRDWGFVPEENLIGRAFGVWMSWDSDNIGIRWNRIGKRIK